MERESTNINDFEGYLVEIAKQLIDESAEIFFEPCQKMGEHIFGDIQITKHTSSKVNLLKELSKREGVAIIEQHIPPGIRNEITNLFFFLP